MRRNPELMQFEMGTSTMRYLPASGTAGFARSFVSGKSRVPCPPPIITERTLLVLRLCRPLCDIRIQVPLGIYTLAVKERKCGVYEWGRGGEVDWWIAGVLECWSAGARFENRNRTIAPKPDSGSPSRLSCRAVIR